jgi:AraC-like DNA-binding protein
MFRYIIVSIPIYVSLFWSLVFLTDKFSANKPRYWLGLFMLIVAVLYACHSVYFLGYKEVYLKLDSLYLITGLSVYPMYYLYIRLLTCDLKLHKSYVFHFLPAIVLSFALSVAIYFADTDDRLSYFNNVLVDYRWPRQEASPALMAMSSIFFTSRFIFGIQALAYLFLGYRLAKKHNQQIANFYSNLEGKELVWVKLLTVSFLLTSAASSMANILGRGLFMDNDILLAIPSILFSSLFFIIGLQGNKQDFNVKSIEKDTKDNSLDLINHGELRNAMLKNGLEELLKNGKRYLDPELKITDLCKELSTNRTYLSNLINNEFHLSFNDLINKYRVEYSISLIKNDLRDNFSLDDISSASGFGSLSSFNRAFKKNTGMTVSRYKVSLRK